MDEAESDGREAPRFHASFCESGGRHSDKQLEGHLFDVIVQNGDYAITNSPLRSIPGRHVIIFFI